MKIRYGILSLFVFWLSFSSCRKDQLNDCFQSTGSDVTEIRDVGSFNGINVGEKFKVKIFQDSTLPEQVSITCGKNIIGQITAKVKNNILVIENKNTCNFVRSYDREIKIEIRVRFLTDIEIHSATDVSCDELLHFEKINHLKLKNFGLGDVQLKMNVGFLDVQSINSGNIILEGFANILSCSIEEVTQFDGRKLEADDIYFDCHTPLDCYVNPRNFLFAKIFNSGNVYYAQTPAIKLELVERKGSGDLLKLD